jgi:hypothetical protein
MACRRPEVLWTANVGPGYGGPVVKAGKVYLLDRDDKTGDIMRCFDLNTERNYGNTVMMPPGPLCSPVHAAYLPSMINMYGLLAITETCIALILKPKSLYGILISGPVLAVLSFLSGQLHNVRSFMGTWLS